ncbi:acyltransferase [Niabella sp. W65]|nr:acyltransferase [Niabella sp. W65]MCH7365036.1 acyltransferase [Niabella sp. W65]
MRNPLQIDKPQNIIIGKRTYIGYKAWLAAVPIVNTGSSELKIGDGCGIGNFNHIYATKSVIIENDVLTADKVYISDNLHSFDDISIPIIYQPVKQIKEVVIGSGSWIGENVCILGASIGKNCVIGANSVVNRDIPDYSVAVGAPAKIVRDFAWTNRPG